VPRLTRETLDERSEEVAERLRALLQLLALPELESLDRSRTEWISTRLDRQFLTEVGKLWDDAPADRGQSVVPHPLLEQQVRELATDLEADEPRSVLLVGESGVGKSALARVLLEGLQARGWSVFEAGASEMIAGQIYMGELEQRLQRLLRQIQARRRVIWFIPNFSLLAWAGRHQYSQTAVLDLILPSIERGEILVVGECQPHAFEQLAQMQPRCRTALRNVRIRPLGDEATLDLGREWLRRQSPSENAPQLMGEETLQEAWQLAQQYLADRAAPGSLLHFLSQTVQRLRAVRSNDETRPLSVTIDDLIVTLSALTGLPSSLLDEREGLDLDALRRFFESRVLQQPEAVECLVERVAMIKAGVTDPTRPAGVFLFAGPTGTGKTEIAKGLAEYLFGAPERMIRLDMSELQTPESLPRLMGESVDLPGGDRSLAERIREQPFSVILLDEFEKAHPNVWDLFLQVFDDGRLTDRKGFLADFRHAIIIMTSNLGGAIPRGTSLGFTSTGQRFRAETVTREIDRVFRREFLNRIDRIVIFLPLGRETMREILELELERVFQRRGLRNRSWAVEWDDAAIDFLLERGFTADLGARPLKRAIERYLLSPLATTIVNHQFPQGDQFLFVRTNGEGLQVVFVDPDEPAKTEPETAPPSTVEGAEPVPGLGSIALHPTGSQAEIASIVAQYERLNGVVHDSTWQERKGALLSSMSSADFWNSAGRFGVLGDVEYRDRIESGLERCGSLLGRLTGGIRRERSRYPRELVRGLAQQLYLLGEACADVEHHRPRDAYVLIESGHGTGPSDVDGENFGTQLGRMYRAWARRRNMQLDVLEEAGGDEHTPYRLLFGVSGFGCYSILAPEAGLHIFEKPDGTRGHSVRKYTARVRVAAQPEEPLTQAEEQRRLEVLRAQAMELLQKPDAGPLTIVRRYRESPSPLVRDAVRGWRSGHLDLVLGGDFDLIAEPG